MNRTTQSWTIRANVWTFRSKCGVLLREPLCLVASLPISTEHGSKYELLFYHESASGPKVHEEMPLENSILLIEPIIHKYLSSSLSRPPKGGARFLGDEGSPRAEEIPNRKTYACKKIMEKRGWAWMVPRTTRSFTTSRKKHRDFVLDDRVP